MIKSISQIFVTSQRLFTCSCIWRHMTAATSTREFRCKRHQSNRHKKIQCTQLNTSMMKTLLSLRGTNVVWVLCERSMKREQQRSGKVFCAWVLIFMDILSALSHLSHSQRTVLVPLSHTISRRLVAAWRSLIRMFSTVSANFTSTTCREFSFLRIL